MIIMVDHIMCTKSMHPFYIGALESIEEGDEYEYQNEDPAPSPSGTNTVSGYINLFSVPGIL